MMRAYCNCYRPGDCDGSCTHSEPDVCEACDGSGVEVFGITVYEPGCSFSHESSDERPCPLCDGSGLQPPAPYEPDSPPYPVKMNEGDLPF